MVRLNKELFDLEIKNIQEMYQDNYAVDKFRYLYKMIYKKHIHCRRELYFDSFMSMFKNYIYHDNTIPNDRESNHQDCDLCFVDDYNGNIKYADIDYVYSDNITIKSIYDLIDLWDIDLVSEKDYAEFIEACIHNNCEYDQTIIGYKLIDLMVHRQISPPNIVNAFISIGFRFSKEHRRYSGRSQQGNRFQNRLVRKYQKES